MCFVLFTGLFEERAIVLGKLGRHEHALAIYMSILRDVPRAVEYCDKVFYLLCTRFNMLFALSLRYIQGQVSASSVAVVFTDTSLSQCAHMLYLLRFGFRSLLSGK
jgi:hypothetical protein